jgi:hypothetical protein
MKQPISSFQIFSREDEIRDFSMLGLVIKSNTMMTPNRRQEEYMFQQYMKWIKLVLVITCIILMEHSVEYNDSEQYS